MGKRQRYAWSWHIKEDCLDEYIRMHKNPWPQIMKEHTKAGIHNYSIFQNGNQFFYTFECADVKNAFRYLSESEACQRWNAITSKMVEGSFDFAEDNPIEFLPEVFRLS